MSKRKAIFSIFILMLAFLAFGIVNVAMGRPSLLTSKLNRDKNEVNLSTGKEIQKTDTASGKGENNDFLSIKLTSEIKDGSSGDEVKKIQYILKDKGIYKGEINGQFTGDFVDSVKAFQKNSSMEQTGKLTIDVIEKITGEKIEIDYSKVAFSRDLYPNMTGVDVKKAQYLLKKAGYYKDEVSGVFDGETKKAVISFQRDKKITQTGNIGKITQKAIEEIK